LKTQSNTLATAGPHAGHKLRIARVITGRSRPSALVPAGAARRRGDYFQAGHASSILVTRSTASGLVKGVRIMAGLVEKSAWPRADHQRGVLIEDLVLIDLCRLTGGSDRSMMTVGVVTPDLSQPASSATTWSLAVTYLAPTRPNERRGGIFPS
jgi:hypothetical protein